MSSLTALLKSRFGPFRNPTFRLFYGAQSVSLIGNWMQEIARSWIVLTLMGKASAMGVLLFASAIPGLILGGIGGSLADQKDFRGILVVTQIALATSAFALGLVVSFGQVELWHLIIFAVLEGSIIAFDVPAFYKVTPRLVDPVDFQQALALNSVNFHLARVIGPSIAGIIMGIWGPATVFWINAVSFLAIVVVITRLPPIQIAPSDADSKKGMREAWAYIRSNAKLSRVIAQLMVIIAIVFPLIFTTFRVFLQEKFKLSSQDYGLVFAVPGAGALMGSLTFLLWSPKNPLKALPYGLTGVVAFLILLAEAPTMPLTILALMFFSYSMFLSISSLTVTVQLTIENRYRGRVSALIGMAFVSLAPIMSAPIGFISDLIGEHHLIWLVASLLAATAVAFAILGRRGRTHELAK